MMDEATISTMDALRCLGFQPDPTIISDTCSGLRFDFGNLSLYASCCVNLRAKEIVLFSGVVKASRRLAEVFFEMPRRTNSLKQCAAWIVWYLDQNADHRIFRPDQHVGWVEEGRESQRLLPWVMSRAEYNARPQCLVQRDWLRLALKTLAGYLTSQSDNSEIVFSFDGAVLSIRCDKKVIVLSGEGSPWTVRLRVEARALRRLPKRLMREHIGVSLWESRITLGNYTYAGTLEQFGTTEPSRVQ
jgi:hypothetical protein